MSEGYEVPTELPGSTGCASYVFFFRMVFKEKSERISLVPTGLENYEIIDFPYFFKQRTNTMLLDYRIIIAVGTQTGASRLTTDGDGVGLVTNLL